MKILRKEQVEMIRVEVEMELTYIDGVLQNPTQAVTVAQIADMVNAEDEESEETSEENA